MIPVNKRGGFSDRNGIKPLNTEIQLTDFDERTRTALFNSIVHFYEHLKETADYTYSTRFPRIYKYFNDLFEREYVGYRFIGRIISPISDNIEVEAVNEALDNKFKAVREHIFKANTFLSNREKPDYENSIKESISAVEAICQEILGTKGGGATLGKMLKKLEDNGVEIHSALKEAFNKLYGYTSDANGIRHAVVSSRLCK